MHIKNGAPFKSSFEAEDDKPDGELLVQKEGRAEMMLR